MGNIPKLSEAILLGIGAVKEDRKLFLRFDNNHNPCGCAIGTALYAIGHDTKHLMSDPTGSIWVKEVTELWPWTASRSQSPIFSNLRDIAQEISDRHLMGESRESIAAWIASIEPKDEPVIESLQLTTNKEVCYEAK